VIQRILIVLGIVLVVLAVVLIFSYEVIAIDFGSEMENTWIIRQNEPPMLQPPADAVPTSRQDYLAVVQQSKSPVPADGVSLQRGALLFGFNCQPCHGALGQGDGPVTKFWKPDARRPANLADPAIGQQLPDGILFQFISNGIGTMPPMRENTTERQRWDLVNHVRTLSAGK
jgi:mono/diheme cytochrome c family protein